MCIDQQLMHGVHKQYSEIVLGLTLVALKRVESAYTKSSVTEKEVDNKTGL